MGLDLEQAILRTLSESLSKPDPIQEAKGDWNTTREVIAKIRAFSPESNPLVNLRAYTMPTSGERKHYQRMIKKHVSSKYFQKYEAEHFAALKAGDQYSRKVLTRGRLAQMLGDESALPAQLRDKWAGEYRQELEALQVAIERKLNSVWAELLLHNNECVRPCIKRTRLGRVVAQGNQHALLDTLLGQDKSGNIRLPGQQIREIAKQLRGAVELAYRPTIKDGTLVQCSQGDAAEILNRVAHMLDARSDELDADLADLIDKKAYLAQSNFVKPLDVSDFEYLRNNPKIGAALMRADQIEVKAPVVTARSTKLEHQIIWQIIKYSKKRKFDPDTDLCAEILPVVREIAKNHDYEDLEGFYGTYVARQLSAHHGADELKAAFEKVISDWSNECKDFLAATRPEYRITDKGQGVSGIAPIYAIPGSEEHEEFRDTGQVPRIRNDQGMGVGGEYGTEHPTVYQVYNDYLDQNPKKEYGFDGENEYTWVAIFGTEESALLSNEDGECPICSGDGYIDLDTIGIPTGGQIDPDYWGVALGEQNSDPGSRQCSNCEGSGRVYPRLWQHIGEEHYTPFELAFREIWDLLIEYEPVAYDGFITDKGKLATDNHYPIPAPVRPEVETQYGRKREGETNTMAYTVIIRLDKPMGGKSRTEVGSHFQSDFYDKLQKKLASARMPVDLTPVTGSETEQEIMVYSLRREPKFTVKRWSRERTDAKRNPARAEANWVSDIEEFEAEYLRLVSDGIDEIIPSQQLLGELEELLNLASELESHKLYDMTVPIYAFLDMDREKYGRQAEQIANYDDYLDIGLDFSYGALLRYLLDRLHLHKDKLRSYERYDRVLTNLRAKSNLYDIEIPGSESTSLSKVTDINEELKLYIRQKERLKQLQRATIFKPNTRGDEEVIIKGIEDVIPIARRINQVFYETQDKHPITNIPINSKDNPIFHLLVPLGRDDAANGIASGEEVKGTTL